MSTNPPHSPLGAETTEPWWFPEENEQQAYPFPLEEPILVEPIRIWPVDQPHPVLNVRHADSNRYQQQVDGGVVGDDMKELMFEKALTPSDVGKLNRLVIPKSKAEAHLPAGADGYSPTHGKGLILDLEDENGKWWNFRYSYWHSSQSYVLTKGWTRFVKEKRLEAGDVVMFHRHRFHPNRFFVSWRRRHPSEIPPARPRRSHHPETSASGDGAVDVDDENENDDGDNNSGYNHENSESGVGRVREFYPEFLAHPTQQQGQHLSNNPDYLPHLYAGEVGSEAPNGATAVDNGTGSASGSGGCWVFGVNIG